MPPMGHSAGKRSPRWSLVCAVCRSRFEAVRETANTCSNKCRLKLSRMSASERQACFTGRSYLSRIALTRPGEKRRMITIR